MNDYQKEQYETIVGAGRLLKRLKPEELSALENQIEEYLEYRKRVERFLSQYFSSVCAHACYQNRRSACCSRDGIITFFADAVINMLVSSADEIETICALIQQPLADSKCIYLGENGCIWRIKPIVCEMFLCESSMAQVFDHRPKARQKWETFLCEKKRFTWPDQPVLFDQLESYFIDAGYTSPLMYFHNSPGLLRVKQNAGIGC